jgi:Helicase conserved C-terminal domain
MAEVVVHIIKTTTVAEGAILIFLPGVEEIRQCMATLRASSIGGQVEIFPLHANLSNDEQRRVFTATKLRKIVVATNVAEVCPRFDGYLVSLLRCQYRLPLPFPMLYMLWTVARSKKRNMTPTLDFRALSKRGSLELPRDNAGVERAAHALANVTSFSRAYKRTRWSNSQFLRFFAFR